MSQSYYDLTFSLANKTVNTTTYTGNSQVKLSGTSIEPSSAGNVLQTNSAGTSTEWGPVKTVENPDDTVHDGNVNINSIKNIMLHTHYTTCSCPEHPHKIELKENNTTYGYIEKSSDNIKLTGSSLLDSHIEVHNKLNISNLSNNMTLKSSNLLTTHGEISDSSNYISFDWNRLIRVRRMEIEPQDSSDTGLLTVTGAINVTGTISATDDITAFSSSDKRLKKNIVPIQTPLYKINQLNGISYDWEDSYLETHDTPAHDVGLLAQDVQKVLPEVVKERESGYLAIRYEKMVPLLIEGIKELSNKVDALLNQNSVLTNRIQVLETNLNQ